MKVLGIETSCDETGVALYDTQKGLIGHRLYSQISLHEAFGGVVPELASRDHIRKLLPLVAALLEDHSMSLQDLDGVAYTAGPGLVGALMVGACWGRSLAWALDKPAIAVHHMEAHLLAPLLEDDPPGFPFVALLVSGGHTLLVKVEGIGQYEILGESIDDAAGEAFDKTAKLLGLPYPGGPNLAKLAEQGQAQQYNFPRPMLNKPNFNFSFSGLKTSVLHAVQKLDNPSHQQKADIAQAFQAAVVDTLVGKCRQALMHTNLSKLVVAGGVSANQALRYNMNQMTQKLGVQNYYPSLPFCTDNGAMIALTGALRLQGGQTSDLAIQVIPRWPLTDLSKVEPNHTIATQQKG